MTTLFFPILLVFFSFSVNLFYGSIGVLPIDTFSHFDTGFRILKGDTPFIDYWTTSGPIIDMIQAIFFKIFGINWFSYILNGSLFNSIVSLFTYFFFRLTGLNIKFSFFYALCFSFLANPSMGSPFVDHYSTFFSLMSIFSFLYAIYTKKNYFFYFVPLLLFLAFFCKQTPSGYTKKLYSKFLFLYFFSYNLF